MEIADKLRQLTSQWVNTYTNYAVMVSFDSSLSEKFVKFKNLYLMSKMVIKAKTGVTNWH